ncbi:hypothetical protein K7432_015417 [Basidiobolus ranarum]|uniref:Uncharacterized protein n=1 Tax=Basidiobolus ranarum TaxID=34480 RepID=A0ABR2WG36_9FUNG
MGLRLSLSRRGYTSKKVVVPGETFKKKVSYPPVNGLKKIYIDGKPTRTKVRIPGKTVIKKIRIPEEYGYKRIIVPGQTITKKVRVPGGTKKYKYKTKTTYKLETKTVPGGTTIKTTQTPGQTVTRKIRTDPRYTYKRVPVKGAIIKKKFKIPGRTVKTRVPIDAEYKYIKYTVPGGTKVVKTRVPGKISREKIRIPGEYGYKTVKQIVPPTYKKIYVPGKTIIQKVLVPTGKPVDVYLPPNQEYVEEFYDERTGTYVHRLKHCTWDVDQKQYKCVVEKDSIDEYLQPDVSPERNVPREQHYVEEYYDEITRSIRRRYRICSWRSDIRDTVCRTEEIGPIRPADQPIADPGTSITNVYLPPDRVYTEEYLDETTNTVRRKLRICTWNVEDKRYTCTSRGIDDNTDSGVKTIITEFVDTITGVFHFQNRECKLSSEGAQRECTDDNGVSSDGYRPLRPTDQTYRDTDVKKFANDIIRDDFRIETVYWPEDSSSTSNQRIYVYQYLDKPSKRYKRRLMICRLRKANKQWECATSIDKVLDSPIDIAQVNPRNEKVNTIKLTSVNEVETIHLSTDTNYPSDRIYVQEYLDPITNGIQQRVKVCKFAKNSWECTMLDTGSTYGQLSQTDITVDEEETVDLYIDSTSGKITRKAKVCKTKYKNQCENKVSKFGGYKPLVADRSGYSPELSLYSGIKLQSLYWPETNLNVPVPDRVYVYEFIDQTVTQVERRTVICRYDPDSQTWLYTSVPAEKLSSPIDFNKLNRPDQDKEIISLRNGNSKELIHISSGKYAYGALPADRIYIQEYFESTTGFIRRRVKTCSFDGKLQQWRCQDKSEELGGTDPFANTVQLPSDRTYVEEYINSDTGRKSTKTTICRYDISKRDWNCSSSVKNTTVDNLGADLGSSWTDENSAFDGDDSSWSEYIDTQEIYDPSTGARRTRSKVCKLDSAGKWKCTANKNNGFRFNDDSDFEGFSGASSEDSDFDLLNDLEFRSNEFNGIGGLSRQSQSEDFLDDDFDIESLRKYQSSSLNSENSNSKTGYSLSQKGKTHTKGGNSSAKKGNTNTKGNKTPSKESGSYSQMTPKDLESKGTKKNTGYSSPVARYEEAPTEINTKEIGGYNDNETDSELEDIAVSY